MGGKFLVSLSAEAGKRANVKTKKKAIVESILTAKTEGIRQRRMAEAKDILTGQTD